MAVHDPTFVAWDRSLSALRDTANVGIRALNQVGASLEELPEGSLEEVLVLPLTGDPSAIRGNAAACHDAETALAAWSGQLVHLSVEVAATWRGCAATAFLVRLDATAVAGAALAALVGQGARVFDAIAELSEHLALEVERLVVALGEALRRLAARLVTQVAGPLGWAVLVDDVRRVSSLIAELHELQELTRDWVGEQRARLEVLLDLPRLLVA